MRRSRSSERPTSASKRRNRMPSQDEVLEALKKVRFPGLSRDIVSFGFIHDLRVDGGDVIFTVRLQTENPAVGQQIARDAESAVRALPGVTNVHVSLDIGARQAAAPQMGQGGILPGVKYKIAVASGKGG